MEKSENDDIIITLTGEDIALFFKENEKEAIRIFLPWIKEKKQITDQELLAINKGEMKLELRFEKEYIYIKDLSLAERVKKVLAKRGFSTLNELSNKTEAELLGIRGLGQTGVEEIILSLKKFNFNLKKD